MRFEKISKSISLPPLEAGNTYKVPERLYGCIFDNPIPNESAQKLLVIFLPNGAKKMQQMIQVEYPMKLVELKSPLTLFPGKLEVTTKNISNCVYGSSGKSKVELSLHSTFSSYNCLGYRRCSIYILLTSVTYRKIALE